MIKKYLVMGGRVFSFNDGEMHYVNAFQLCKLYGVDQRECILSEENKPETWKEYNLSKYEVLTPRYDGNYNLRSNAPKGKEEK